jgi:hypothetical protein
MLKSRVMAAASFAVFAVSAAVAADPPTPPPSTVPDLLTVRPLAMCVGCDEPFDTTGHKNLLEKLASNQYLAQLRRALYLQDTVHQFESKAHFDNCDFDASAAYVTSLLEEANGFVAAAQKANAAGDDAAMKTAAENAFFAIGQALHGVQDFYAHTNYVELQAPKVQKVTHLEVVAPWRPKGRDRILELQRQGLISGFVFWGVPQKCPKGTPSHADLAKDTASTKSGAKVIPHLENMSQYRIAVFLAREASLQLMTDAFKRWPLLKELNGEHVAFEVLLDRRDADTKR